MDPGTGTFIMKKTLQNHPHKFLEMIVECQDISDYDDEWEEEDSDEEEW